MGSMTTLSKTQNRPRLRQRVTTAFTLVEVMISLSLFAMIMAAIVPTFITFLRHSTSLGNYTEMSMQSRFALELIAQDLHSAENITQASTNSITVLLPEASGGATVNYNYNSSSETLTRTTTSDGTFSSKVLFADLDQFEFTIYNRIGYTQDPNTWASILSEAKSIQMDAVMQRKLLSTKNTDYVISAKFMMRNL